MHTQQHLLLVSFKPVSDKEVIPVEIHSVGNSTEHGHEEWLRDRHIQEILQLLHGTVTAYIEMKGNKQASNEQLQKPSDIVTGSSVRFGYMFRSRPASQMCLIEELSGDHSLQSFRVLKDKLVVFAHPLVPGSPKGMSQLMKVLNVKRQSTGQSVSISSYFQKIPTQTLPQTVLSSQSNLSESSESQSAVTDSCVSESNSHSQNSLELPAKENQSVNSLPEAPPSEGRRKKIKDILGRGEIGLSKRRRKRDQKSKENVSVNGSEAEEGREVASEENKTSLKSKVFQPDLSSRSDTNCFEEIQADTFDKKCSKKKYKFKESSKETVKTGSMSEVYPTDNRDQRGIESNGICKSKKTNSKMIENVTVTACSNPLLEAVSEESYMIGDVQVSRVESPGVNIENDMNENEDSITLVSVEQMKEIQRDKSNSQSTPNWCLNNQSDSADDISDKQLEPQSDSSSEMLALPSASFCTEEARRKSNAIDMNKLKNYLKSCEGDIDTDSVTESPKFRNRKSEKDKEADKEETACKSPDELTEQDESKADKRNSKARTEKMAHNKNNAKTLHKQRFKRKFPSFSDSDSDESLPQKKTKVKANSDKFVNLENMKKSSKKIQISNSFFTGDQGKAQPTLSFFMSNKKDLPDEKGVSSETRASKASEVGISKDVEDKEEDIEDIDCELIKELSDFPKVKNEADVELKNEIHALSSIEKLNEEHLQYLIRSNEKYLRSIFEGKVSCERHQDYKKGGKSKRNLNYNSRLCQYSEEQVETVMDSLIKIFCKRHNKYLDYILKVLLPEMLIKLHMDVNGTSHEESEKCLASKASH